MKMSYPPSTVDVAKLRLKPGDLVLVSYKVPLTPTQATQLHNMFQTRVPEGVKVIVKTSDLTVKKRKTP